MPKSFFSSLFITTIVTIGLVTFLMPSTSQGAASPITPPPATITLSITTQSTQGGTIQGNLTVKNLASRGVSDAYYAIALYTPQMLTTATVDGKQVTQVKRDLVSFTQPQNNFSLQGGETKSFPFQLSYSSHIAPGSYTLQASVFPYTGDFLATSPVQINLTGAGDKLAVTKL